jgi:hypothetical protein
MRNRPDSFVILRLVTTFLQPFDGLDSGISSYETAHLNACLIF